MAKKINEKITNTHQLSIEGMFNFDEINNGKIIIDVEDKGEVDAIPLLKKFNGKYGKLGVTVKTEILPEE